MEWNWIAIFGGLASLGVLSYVLGFLGVFIIPANRKPGEATAWLLFIVLAPILGVFLFFLLGSPKLSRWRREQQQHMNERIKEVAEEAEQIPALAAVVDPPLPARFEPHVNLIARLSGMPVMAGNTVELLPDYVGAVDRIVQDIDAAKRFVHLKYFMFADDKIGSRVIDALVARPGNPAFFLPGAVRSSQQPFWLQLPVFEKACPGA